MLKLEKFVFNPFSENTYIIWDDVTKESAIIDPGCYEDYEKEELKTFVTENRLSVKFLINTHCHIDHVLGCAFVLKEYKPQFYIPEKDIELLAGASTQGAVFGISIDQIPKAEKFIDEDLVLKLGEIEIKFLFTPGHTPGEYSLFFEKEKICISGDVLFQNSIGRTDLWGGDFSTLINSIKTKLLTLPNDTTVYPGHGGETTIGEEKIHNPFLK